MAKRTFDLAAALLLLAVLSPVLLAAAAAIRLTMGGPVLFRQERPGRGMEPFRICKFRTMSDRRDASGRLLPDEERLTATGALLRKCSIDELPQLFNVIRGEMSLVGPRPLLMRYLPYFTAEEKARFRVRPGITGLAQISGRNGLPWNERLALDVRYVENRSFWLDIDILARTVKKVWVREGFIEVTAFRQHDLDAERKSIGG